jgi:ubiquinone biosynthesis protein Coq4
MNRKQHFEKSIIEARYQKFISQKKDANIKAEVNLVAAQQGNVAAIAEFEHAIREMAIAQMSIEMLINFTQARMAQISTQEKGNKDAATADTSISDDSEIDG